MRSRRGAAAGTAVALVGAAAVLGAALVLSDGHRGVVPTPVGADRPRAPAAGDVPGARPAARLVTYAAGGTIHWGGRAIDVHEQTRGTQVERHSVHYLDATDDGVVFVVGLVKPERDKRGRVTGLGFGASAVWFTDGSTPVRIGTTAGSPIRGFGIARSVSGSLLVWKEPGDERTQLLARSFGPIVVYDTARMREVARFGGPDAFPLEQVYPDAVFWVPDARSCRWTQFGPVTQCRAVTPVTRLDIGSGIQSEVTWAEYQAERRSRPGLLTGPDRRPSACLTCGVRRDGLYPSLSFVRRGRRLVVAGDFGLRIRALPVADRRTTVALTGQPVLLRLPPRSREAEQWVLTQWLDPDRVVLWADGAPAGVRILGKRFELLVCRLSTGGCRRQPGPGHAYRAFTAPGPAGIGG
jgi:hypothetical protein